MSEVTPRLFRTVLVACIGGGLLLLLGAKEAYEILDSKANAQSSQTRIVTEYTNRYRALQAAQTRFVSSYPPESSFTDWRSYFRYFDFPARSLKVDLDRLVVSLYDPPPTPGTPDIGIRRACIATDQGNDLVIQANSYAGLLDGVSKLISRPDVSVEMVTLTGDKPIPEARLSQFCLIFRKTSGEGRP